MAHPEVPDHTITQLHFLCGWKRGGLYKSLSSVLGSLLHNLCSMEPLGCLSVLLASFLVLSWVVPFADSQITSPPAPPRLTFFRPPHTFAHGEQVQLTCTIPEGQTASKFSFCEKKTDADAWTLAKEQKNNTLEVSATRLEPNKTFVCSYWGTDSAGRSAQSVWSDLLVVSFSDGVPEPPKHPRLALSPWHYVYIQGEEVALICSAPQGQVVTRYTFYQKTGHGGYKALPGTRNSTFKLNGKAAGWYECVYWIQLSSGQEIQSQWSNSVYVDREEPPQPPTLSLQPQHPIYIQGEEVTLICSSPKGKAAARYGFYQEKTRFSVERLTCHNKNLCRLNGKAAGTFLCVYWIHVSGREIQSQSSISVSVTRTDPFPAPVLRVDPPPGAVNEGEPLLISCLANRSNMEKRFHFSRDGVEMDSSNEGSLGDPSPNATLRIPQANSSHSGKFACRYEEKMSSRWVFSPWSQTVNITVHAQDSSLPATVYACFALLLLIPVVSLTCYYYCWRRKRASKGQEEFQPQENQEETGNLGKLESQATALQLQVEARLKRLKPVEKEEVSYSEIQFRPPRGLNRLKPVEEDGVLYSKIQFRPPHGLNRLKPVGDDGVTYSEIQVQPTHRPAK